MGFLFRRTGAVVAVALMLLPCGSPLSAMGRGEDEAGGSRMTLRDCLQWAVSNSTRIRICEADRDDARLNRRDALLRAVTPQVNASTYAYYNFGRSIDPQTNTYFTQTSFHNNYSISAGFDLFDGFEAVNNYRISKTSLSMSDSEQQSAEADICLAVMEAYYNVVYYTQLSDIYSKMVDEAKAKLTLASRQEELGLKGHADVVQIQADLAQREYELIEMRNRLLSEKMNLEDLMFWPVDTPLEIDTEVPLPEAAPTREEDIVESALRLNPQMSIARGKVDNARLQLSTAKWQVLPTLGLYAGWNTSYYTYMSGNTDPFATQFRNNGGQYIELALSIPLWDRMARSSRISKGKNALRRAEAQLDENTRKITSEVHRAVQDMNGQEASYIQARRLSEVQQEAFALNGRKLEEGLISPLEFQTASNNYLKAKADEMGSLLKFLIKQSVVKYYSGIPYQDQ